MTNEEEALLVKVNEEIGMKPNHALYTQLKIKRRNNRKMVVEGTILWDCSEWTNKALVRLYSQNSITVTCSSKSKHVKHLA